jgi:hypothetical protein
LGAAPNGRDSATGNRFSRCCEDQIRLRSLPLRAAIPATIARNLLNVPVWAISDLRLEDFDANSADVILQALLFGEVI